VAGLTRNRLLVRGATGGFALVGAGSLAGLGAGTALADNLTDADLANLRLLVGAELLAADFYGKALQAQPYGASGTRVLKRALFNDGEHYAALGGYLTGAGQAPLTADDVDFAYPRGSFASTAAVTKLAVSLETTFLGAYLGAVTATPSPLLKGVFAQIAASQAQHLALFGELLGREPFGLSFPAPLTTEAASDALAEYTS
jgi:hypothetical protein